MKLGYSSEAKGAKAIGRELHISPKVAREIAGAVRGKKLEDAKEYLEQVMEKKQHVKYRRFRGKTAHRKGGPGGYPIKAAEEVLKVLQSAEANTDDEGLVIRHISASRARVQVGRRKGSASNTNTTHLQVVLVKE